MSFESKKLASAIDGFDLDNPSLPQIIEEEALVSGNYPYEKKLKNSRYEQKLLLLQIELVKLQTHLRKNGERIVAVFEGRDAAGKGGVVKRYRENLNPRHTKVVALPAPSDREQVQWYFQRYTCHMPAGGETMLFDRSWYNRAVVEPVMGFCTPEQTELFFQEVPSYEKMLVQDGIKLFKFWLNISRPMQIKRFHDRRHSPLKYWKLSPVDLRALGKWDEYSNARNQMLERSHTDFAPWTIVRANDKRRARLGAIATVLNSMDYAGKDKKLVGDIDQNIIMSATDFMKQISDQE
ncbi:Polyphosphate kinase 2 [hydrothermal vent metagenome]|uniref:Polyphosphate kinase 2 n=1 Tax=hydrothermal vent metagenome TaxID=652676 RepID=A0A3B0TTB0_9ZZZZ